MAQWVKNLLAMQETRVQSQGWEDPLEKWMATPLQYSWWTEDAGGLQSMGHKDLNMTKQLPLPLSSCYGFFNWFKDVKSNPQPGMLSPSLVIFTLHHTIPKPERANIHPHRMWDWDLGTLPFSMTPLFLTNPFRDISPQLNLHFLDSPDLSSSDVLLSISIMTSWLFPQTLILESVLHPELIELLVNEDPCIGQDKKIKQK